MPLLQNHIAVVTGAGSGIGRAIANGYAREGARVVILDMNEKAAKNRVEGVAGEAKGRVRGALGELTGDDSQKLKGEFEQIKGKAKQALGDVQDALDPDDADKNHLSP